MLMTSSSIYRPVSNLTLTLSERKARVFYDHWIGRSRIFSLLGRLVFRLSGRIYARTFIEQSRLTASDRVLELGCGLGTILLASRQQIQSQEFYLGMDLSLEMICRAKTLLHRSVFPNRIQYLLGSAILLPLADCSFNVVLLSHMVKYLTDVQFGQVMSEARRILKEGGRIVVWEFGPFLSSRVSQFIARKVGGQKLRSATEIRQALKNAGFGDLTQFRIVTPWVPWRNVALSGRANGNPRSTGKK